jgi:hypothetical protein
MTLAHRRFLHRGRKMGGRKMGLTGRTPNDSTSHRIAWFGAPRTIPRPSVCCVSAEWNAFFSMLTHAGRPAQDQLHQAAIFLKSPLPRPTELQPTRPANQGLAGPCMTGLMTVAGWPASRLCRPNPLSSNRFLLWTCRPHPCKKVAGKSRHTGPREPSTGHEIKQRP